MTVRSVEPDFPVKPDVTGAAQVETTPSGTLYAPEKKETAPVVAPHQCNKPKPYVKLLYDGTEDSKPPFISMRAHEHDVACNRIPHGSFWVCDECQTVYYLNCFYIDGRSWYDHSWYEVKWYMWRKIKEAKKVGIDIHLTYT